MLPFLKKMLPILKKMLPILKKMLPFQLATFWYVVKKVYFNSLKLFSRFNGHSFKSERSSKFPHKWVYALGSYRQSPFITGHYSMSSPSTYGLKTEILIYRAEKSSWIQAADYPFSNGNRYIKNEIHFVCMI